MKATILVAIAACACVGSRLSAQSRIAPVSPQQSRAASAAPSSPGGELRSAAVINTTEAEARALSTDGRDLVIGNGDLLEISVYGAPEFDKLQARVSSSGNLILPFTGVQHVEGLTAAQAQDAIAKSLTAGGYFRDPQVSVFVREYSSQGVSVLGEVQKPGVYPLFGPRRLFDAISMAGGLTPKAGKLVTVAHRTQSDNPRSINLGDMQNSTETNTLLAPGDTVVVSKAGIVYVVGDVRLPGGFVMENGGMTVLQALALAQGANPTASLDRATLIRSMDGKQTQTSMQLQRILSAKAGDVTLAPGDILFVPSSMQKTAARRSLDAIVQVATGVAVYGRY